MHNHALSGSTLETRKQNKMENNKIKSKTFWYKALTIQGDPILSCKISPIADKDGLKGLISSNAL